MKHKILGSVLQTLNVELQSGESLYSESGAMSWMSNNIKMQTSAKGGFMQGIKRKFTGESFFMNTFACTEGTGIITFSCGFPGKILVLDLNGKNSYICQKDAFLCATPEINLEMHFRKKFGAGFFGGEGFILQKISGRGKAFVELSGEIVELNLKAGQTLRVDTGHIAMYEPSVNFDIVMVQGVTNILVGGEGMFLSTLTGPGKIWLQSMPLSTLAMKLGKFYKSGGGGVISNIINGVSRGV